MNFILSLALFILILGILVFVHELGHFAVAKWVGMRVDEFAIGFPPRLWGKKKGDTLYAINAIPLGGYVKIHGENPEQRDDEPNSFQKKSVPARIAVIVAGVAMNLILAFVILTIAFSVGFFSVGQDLEKVPGAVVKDSKVVIADVRADSGAAKAGLQPGDFLVSLKGAGESNSTAIQTIPQLQEYTKRFQAQTDRKVEVAYTRAGKLETVQATLAATGPALGIAIQPLNTTRVPFYRAPVVAVKEIGYILDTTWQALKGFGTQLFHAKLDQNVSGPVGIYKATATAAQEGVAPVIFLLVALSVNLALLNILPIPALDGGKLIFLLTELIFRRRVIAERVENWISLAGITVLIGLIVIVTIKDIIHLF